MSFGPGSGSSNAGDNSAGQTGGAGEIGGGPGGGSIRGRGRTRWIIDQSRNLRQVFESEIPAGDFGSNAVVTFAGSARPTDIQLAQVGFADAPRGADSPGIFTPPPIGPTADETAAQTVLNERAGVGGKEIEKKAKFAVPVGTVGGTLLTGTAGGRATKTLLGQ